MGHREDLLEGARRCLFTRGYARTTARDIVAASGTNLASIGYHYGSTEALMNLAMDSAIGEWGDELQRTLSTLSPARPGSLERFESFWKLVLASFTTHRQLWGATFEALAQIDRLPDFRKSFADGIESARLAWSQLLAETHPPKQARAIGSLHQALLSGVIVQWYIDPDRAPSARELATAMQLIADGLSEKRRPAVTRTKKK